MARNAVVALGCALAVVIAVACRQEAPAPPPLQPDPGVAERIARQQASTKEYEAARAMTAEQAAELEARLAQNPEDRDARGRLQIFYRFSGPKTIGWNETVAARRRHILWSIEHQPGDPLTLQWGAINPDYDPQGYAAAKKLWLAQTSKKDASPDVLSNAAYFFEPRDKPLAEQMLLRAQAVDPGGPQPRVKEDTYRLSWPARLGELYAKAIAGVGGSEYGIPRFNADEARKPFTAEARRKLEASTDAESLAAAGRYLLRDVELSLQGRVESSSVVRQQRADLSQLGRSYLERAAKLDPDVAPRAEALLVQQRTGERNLTIYAKLKDVPKERQPAVIAAEPPGTRISVVPMRAQIEYMNAEFHEYVEGDKAAAGAARERARKYAEDLLALAQDRPDDPNRGAALFAAHTTLGCLALHDGDKRAALRHMEEAVKVPASQELQYGFDMLWMRLAVGMLKRGEYEAVATFLDGYAKLNVSARESLTKAASAIRAGKMPEFYQYQMARAR